MPDPGGAADGSEDEPDLSALTTDEIAELLAPRAWYAFAPVPEPITAEREGSIVDGDAFAGIGSAAAGTFLDENASTVANDRSNADEESTPWSCK